MNNTMIISATLCLSLSLSLSLSLARFSHLAVHLEEEAVLHLAHGVGVGEHLVAWEGEGEGEGGTPRVGNGAAKWTGREKPRPAFSSARLTGAPRPWLGQGARGAGAGAAPGGGVAMGATAAPARPRCAPSAPGGGTHTQAHTHQRVCPCR